MVAISDARGLAYDFAKRRGRKWFIVKQLAEGAYIDIAAAQSAVNWYTDMRVFECNSHVRPRSYRMNAHAGEYIPELLRDIENAVGIVLDRVREEAKARQQFFRQSKSVYGHQPGPSDRRSSTRSDDSAGADHVTGADSSRSVDSNSSFAETASRVETTSARDATGNKTERLFAMLERPDGASMDELTAALSVQAHSVRAMISVKTRERGRRAILNEGRYRLADGPRLN